MVLRGGGTIDGLADEVVSLFFFHMHNRCKRRTKGGRPVQSWGWRAGSENVTSEMNIGIKDQLSHWSFRHFIFIRSAKRKAIKLTLMHAASFGCNRLTKPLWHKLLITVINMYRACKSLPHLNQRMIL